MEKGFTLVELLAVIVILAIIALIATPIIINIISQVQDGANLRSVEGYAKALETSYYTSMIKGAATDLNSLTPEYNGATVICETKQIVNNKIALTNCTVDGKGTFDYTNGKAKKTGETTSSTNILAANLTKGTAVYFNPETKALCNESDAVSTTGTKTGCMKWYTYKDNGNGTYQLILDHNTTATVAWNSTGSSTSMKEVATSLSTDTSTWNSSLNARLITANEIAAIVGADSESTLKWNSSKTYGTTIDTQASWFYLDGTGSTYTTWLTQTANATTKSAYAWLYDYTNGCTTYGCNIADSSTYGYWTSDPVVGNSGRAWRVDREGILLNNNVINYNGFGVRPVITV